MDVWSPSLLPQKLGPTRIEVWEARLSKQIQEVRRCIKPPPSHLPHPPNS